MTVQEHDVALPGGHLRVLEVGRPGALPAADSEVVVLVHGLAGGAATWAPLLAELDRRDVAFPVIAPDLIGHPNADYSLGGYANEIRDLLTARGHRRATIVGHSLGGGIALQFCYQYPQICGRLVLVDAGGLGPELHPVLRAATLPGAEWALPLLAHTRVISTVGWLVDSGRAILGRGTTGHHTLSAFGSLADGARRRAFVITARNIINIAGQRVSGVDKLHLTAEVPTMIVWGGRDPIIPAAHARQATAALPDARVEVFENAGHFPHCDEPVRFADLLLDFLAGTTPATRSAQR
jgi:pimeloyl-ACP methyl ester carboxylesterase